MKIGSTTEVFTRAVAKGWIASNEADPREPLEVTLKMLLDTRDWPEQDRTEIHYVYEEQPAWEPFKVGPSPKPVGYGATIFGLWRLVVPLRGPVS